MTLQRTLVPTLQYGMWVSHDIVFSRYRVMLITYPARNMTWPVHTVADRVVHVICHGVIVF